MSVKSKKVNYLNSYESLRFINRNGRYAIVYKDETEPVYHIDYGTEGFPSDIRTQYETLETVEFQMRQFESDLRKWKIHFYD